MRFMCIVVVLLGAAPASAQQPDDPPEYVPLEFVQRLTGNQFGTPTSILVGRLAAGVADLIDVGGLRAVGALGNPNMSMNAAVAAGLPAVVEERLVRHVESAGWTQLPQVDVGSERGFVTTSLEVAPLPSFCAPDGSRLVLFRFAPHGADSTALDIVHLSGMFAGQCNATGRGVPPRMRDMMTLPVLPPPGDAVVEMTSSQGTHVDGASSARLSTTRPLAEVAAHYAAAMRADGWTARDPLIGPDAVMQSFERTTAEGTEGTSHALLVIHRRGGDWHQLRLDVWKEGS